nr:hypothetical protein [Microbispora bryophytorum]
MADQRRGTRVRPAHALSRRTGGRRAARIGGQHRALTADGLPRLLRVAWTLADLRGVDRPQLDDAAGALELWKGANGDGAR